MGKRWRGNIVNCVRPEHDRGEGGALIEAYTQDFRTVPRLWTVNKGSRVLDLGCGMGLYTKELARQESWPVGLDLNPQNLSRARQHTAGQSVCLVRGDAVYLPFRDESFDMVVSVEVLTHLPPELRRGVFSQINRVLRPRGSAWITLHNSARLNLSRWLRFQRAQTMYPTNNLDVWPTTPAEAERMAQGCGMELLTGVRFLNYHSRFSTRWGSSHPRLASMVKLFEEVLSRAPFLNRLGITFLLCVKKPG